MDMPVEFALFVRYLHDQGDSALVLIVVGVFAGVIARAMSSGPRRQSLLATSGLGIGGAALGAYVAQRLGVAVDGLGMRFVAALAGSLTLVYLFNIAMGHGRREPGPEDES